METEQKNGSKPRGGQVEKKAPCWHRLPLKEWPLLYAELAKVIIPKPELNFSSAFELLIAVLLSAQCTDKCVNRVTAKLWQTLHTPADYLALGEEKLAEAIRSIGFYHVKAQHIIELCRRLVEEYNSQVPETLDALVTLPGVGRKTASVVMNLWFRQPYIAVDTHIFRVAHRTGLSNGKTPDAVSLELMQKTPKEYLLDAHHYLLLLGRYTCKARKPECEKCPIACLCRKNG